MNASKDCESKSLPDSRDIELKRIWEISFYSRHLNSSEGALIVAVSLYLFAFSIDNWDDIDARKTLLLDFLNKCRNENRIIDEKNLSNQIENHEFPMVCTYIRISNRILCKK